MDTAMLAVSNVDVTLRIERNIEGRVTAQPQFFQVDIRDIVASQCVRRYSVRTPKWARGPAGLRGPQTRHDVVDADDKNGSVARLDVYF